MQKITFPFQREKSSIFGSVSRPVAEAFFWSFKRKIWEKIIAIVDTGADYTLLPYYLAAHLGIDLKKECESYPTSGIGGTERVFLFREMPFKIGPWKNKIPIGFLAHDNVPPLLGRQGCLEKIGVVLNSRKTTFVFSR